jgi:hypothetical protein
MDHARQVDEDLLAKITVINEKYRLEGVDSPDKGMITTFIRETTAYLKTLGVDEEVALTGSCHMLSEIKRIKDITPLFIRYSQNHDDHALRVSGAASQVWYKGKQDKQKAVRSPVTTAIALVREHDKERNSFAEKIQNRYVDHLSRDKVEIVCDHAIRHKEATGKVLDDIKIHELACEIQRNENTHRVTDTHQTTEANTQSKILEIYHEQTRRIQETMKTLVLQQQAHQRMLQQERGRGLSL